MKDNRTKNTTRNIIWGVLNIVINTAFPFAVRTVMIYTIGMEYTGLNNLFTSILQVLSFAELGIGTALTFCMYRPMAENDVEKICSLLNFIKRAYRIIGLIILIIGIAVLPFLKLLVKGEIPSNINMYILYCIYLANNVLGYFLFAYKQSLFSASQRIDIANKIALILKVFSSILQICILIFTKSYYLFVIVIPIITCANNIILGKLADKEYPEYKCNGKLEKKELIVIKQKVKALILHQIGSIVITSVDTIVISAFLGLMPLALYQNYYFIVTAIYGFMGVIRQSMVAGVGNSCVTESLKKNYNDFKKFNFAYLWIVVCCSSYLLCMYQPFMKIWVGDNNMLGMGMVILFVVLFFSNRWCDMLAVYQDACGLWWEARFIPLIAAALNLTLNILLVKIIGLPGIVISTIVAAVLVYNIGYSRVLFRTLFKPLNALKEYWVRQMLYLGVALIAISMPFLICNFINIKIAILKLVVSFIVSTVITNLILFIFLKPLKEFNDSKLIVISYIKLLKNKNI